MSKEPDSGVVIGTAADHAHHAATATQSELEKLRAQRTTPPPARASDACATTSALNAVQHTHRRQSVSVLLSYGAKIFSEIKLVTVIDNF